MQSTERRELSHTQSLRQPEPHEELLGIFLTEPSTFTDYKHRLNSELFQDYAWLFRLMVEVEEEEGLTFKGIGARCDIHQIKELHQLRETFISSNRLKTLIKKTKEHHLAFKLRSLSNELQEVTATTADDALRALQKTAFEMFTSDTDEIADMDKEVDAFVDWVEEITHDPSKAYGLMTGIRDMDKITTGWHKQDLIVVGARTSMGKSAFMIENVLRLHQAGKKCAIFSLEMSKRQIYFRMMANLMKVSLELLRTGQIAKELLPKVRAMKDKIKGIYVDDMRGVDSEYIADMIRRLKRTQGLDFVVVDYLQDVKEKGETNDNGGSALARICRKLRSAAQESDVAIMALSQVTRAVEDRKDKRPGNADLSGSTGIETSADVIALLYRDEYYNPTPQNEGILEVNFTKQRNGKLGKVELFYDKTTQSIRPM